MIASKNVCLMAVEKSDLDLYKAKRFDFAYEIGICWFEILDKLKKDYGERII